MPRATPSLRDIRIGTDLADLVAIRAAAGGGRTMTTWDPEFFPGGDAFWIHGIGEQSETVFVIAARGFSALDLKRDLESLRVFYINPEVRQDTCHVDMANMPSIAGRSGHTGNLWVAPAFRGLGIPAIATVAVHREILSRWDVDWIFGLQEKELAYKGLYQDQGYPHCEGQVIWSGNPYGQRFDMKVVYGSRDEISRTL